MRDLASWLFGVRVLYTGHSFVDPSRAVKVSLFNGSVGSVGNEKRIDGATKISHSADMSVSPVKEIKKRLTMLKYYRSPSR